MTETQDSELQGAWKLSVRKVVVPTKEKERPKAAAIAGRRRANARNTGNHLI